MASPAAVKERSETVEVPTVTQQAVFTVCVSDEVALAIMDTTASLPGFDFIGQFKEYISAEKRPKFPEALDQAPGCVALIDCDQETELAFETMERLRQLLPHRLKLVAVSMRTEAEFLLRAMRAGCDDVMKPPMDQAALSTLLVRFQQTTYHAPPPPRGSGRILSFYGVKGGVGNTTLAVHLATHLVKTHHKKVLLIDHKHELGHVALHLGLKEGVYFFDELIRNAQRLDSELLDGFVLRHRSGLDVIPSPNSCARIPEASGEAITQVMNYLRARYDFILFDSSLEYTEWFPTVTASCDEVTLICTPDIAALRDLVRRVEHLTLVSGLADKVKIVINRSTSDDAVSAKDIQQAVRFPISICVPNNFGGLLRALNEGEPVAPQQKSPFTVALAKWAERLAAPETPTMTTKVKRKSLFSF